MDMKTEWIFGGFLELFWISDILIRFNYYFNRLLWKLSTSKEEINIICYNGFSRKRFWVYKYRLGSYHIKHINRKTKLWWKCVKRSCRWANLSRETPASQASLRWEVIPRKYEPLREAQIHRHGVTPRDDETQIHRHGVTTRDYDARRLKLHRVLFKIKVFTTELILKRKPKIIYILYQRTCLLITSLLKDLDDLPTDITQRLPSFY